MTKAICPVCHIEGSVQQRGNSFRVGHYKGYRGDTRLIEWHCTTREALDVVNNTMVNNGCQTHNLENNKRAKKAPSVQKSRARIPPPAPELKC